MLGLARYLPRFGWQPIVVAPPGMPWEPDDPALVARIPPDALVERVPFSQGLWSRCLRWLAPEGHWLPNANRVSQRLLREHRPEVILSSSPPGEVHLLGLRLKRRFGLPLVADFRDPWVTNSSAQDRKWRSWIDRRLERIVMGGADRLVANTPGNQRGWAAAYPDCADKIVTITNGFDPERFELQPVARASGSLAGGLTILHAGELYQRRDPRPVLDALLQPILRDLPIRVDFVGRKTGGNYDFAGEISRRALADHVHLNGQLPYEEAIDRMMRADILLLIHSPNTRIGVPAKLYEYLGTGRPILALADPDGDVAWVLRESQALHRVAPPTDVGRIAQAIAELASVARAGQVAAANRAALQPFTREHMAQRMAECLDACVAKGAP